MGQDKVRGRIDAVNIPPWGATAFDVDGLSDPVATACSVRTSLDEKTATSERWAWPSVREKWREPSRAR